MSLVRVNCFFRDGLDEYKKSTLVVCCGLDETHKVTRGEWPGVIINDNVKTPFLLKVDDQSMVWFEDDNFYMTTFGQRELHLAELFTVGEEWVYEVKSSYQYVNPDSDSKGNFLEKIVKITAVCTDGNRLTKNVFVLWCGLDERACLVDGDWMGYCEDDGTVTPVVVSIGSYSEVNYGENYKEPTDLKSGQVGHHFSIKSVDDNGELDTYKYEIKERIVY